MNSPYVFHYWKTPSEVFVKDDHTIYIGTTGAHTSPMLKFPQGTPVEGQLCVFQASWDACMRRGHDRPVCRRVVTVKPAEAREGREYTPLQIVYLDPADQPSEKTLMLGYGWHISSSGDYQHRMRPILPPVAGPTVPQPLPFFDGD